MKQSNVRFATIPNVIPLNSRISSDIPIFFKAVVTNMEAPFHHLLRRLHPPFTALIADFELHFPVAVARCFGPHDYEEHIAGISSAQLTDLGIVLRENGSRFMQLELELISAVPKADCLIVNTVQELESEVIDSLRAMFHFPIHPIAFPYVKPETSHLMANSDYSVDYLNWLDSHPAISVLYISLGSFLSVSCAQMSEIVSALNTSGVCYLWVVRG